MLAAIAAIQVVRGLLGEWLVEAEAVGCEDVVGEGAEVVFATVVQHGSLVKPGVL
eukprot:SAG11_NODE_1959_length_3999_cov_1.662308_5_plen_55_part_00